MAVARRLRMRSSERTRGGHCARKESSMQNLARILEATAPVADREDVLAAAAKVCPALASVRPRGGSRSAGRQPLPQTSSSVLDLPPVSLVVVAPGYSEDLVSVMLMLLHGCGMREFSHAFAFCCTEACTIWSFEGLLWRLRNAHSGTLPHVVVLLTPERLRSEWHDPLWRALCDFRREPGHTNVVVLTTRSQSPLLTLLADMENESLASPLLQMEPPFDGHMALRMPEWLTMVHGGAARGKSHKVKELIGLGEVHTMEDPALRTFHRRILLDSCLDHETFCSELHQRRSNYDSHIVGARPQDKANALGFQLLTLLALGVVGIEQRRPFVVPERNCKLVVEVESPNELTPLGMLMPREEPRAYRTDRPLPVVEAGSSHLGRLAASIQQAGPYPSDAQVLECLRRDLPPTMAGSVPRAIRGEVDYLFTRDNLHKLARVVAHLGRDVPILLLGETGTDTSLLSQTAGRRG
jgi:hypothetical protein